MTIDDALSHPWLKRVAPEEERSLVCPRVMDRLMSHTPGRKNKRLQQELLMIMVNHMDSKDISLSRNKETFNAIDVDFSGIISA